MSGDCARRGDENKGSDWYGPRARRCRRRRRRQRRRAGAVVVFRYSRRHVGLFRRPDGGCLSLTLHGAGSVHTTPSTTWTTGVGWDGGTGLLKKKGEPPGRHKNSRIGVLYPDRGRRSFTSLVFSRNYGEKRSRGRVLSIRPSTGFRGFPLEKQDLEGPKGIPGAPISRSVPELGVPNQG